MSINSAPVSQNLQEQDPEMELGSFQSSQTLKQPNFAKAKFTNYPKAVYLSNDTLVVSFSIFLFLLSSHIFILYYNFPGEN